jgi:hypothetical protein
MIISSIVIGICYYVYLILDNQFTKYQRNSEAVTEYYLLSHALQEDADRSNEIKIITDNNHLLFSNEETTITYTFYENFVTREIWGKQDTFKLKAVVDSLHDIDNRLNLINCIFLQTELGADHIQFLIQKNYSSQQIMKAEQNQNEQLN